MILIQDGPEILIDRFPMPPSHNNSNASKIVYKDGKAIPVRYKAPNYQVFDIHVEAYRYRNLSNVKLAAAYLKNELAMPLREMPVIRIDTVFCFPTDKIITQDWRPKKNDTFNRPKILHDALSTLLGIDDCYFWRGSADKWALSGKAEPYCASVLTVTDLQAFDPQIKKVFDFMKRAREKA